MDWAPVLPLPLNHSDEPGELRIAEGSRVEWLKCGRLHRVFRMEQPVHSAIFARYARSKPNELWVVIVLEDQTVHSYATATGELKIMGLNITPIAVKPCGRTGVVFASRAGNRLNLSLLEGPEELLQAVVPSSMMEPLEVADELRFIDENVCVVWSRSTVKTYTVKLLRHRGGSTRGADVVLTDRLLGGVFSPAESRAAVLLPLRSWALQGIGRVFTQKLVQNASDSEHWLLAIHDSTAAVLYVLSGLDMVSYDHVSSVAPLAGVHGVPLAVLCADQCMQLRSLFFPYTSELRVDVPVGEIVSGTDENWFDVHAVGKTPQRFALYNDFTPEMHRCLSIIRELMGVEDMFHVVRTYFVSRLDCDSNWETLRLALLQALPLFPVEFLPQMVFQLHMLHEELSLYEASRRAVKELEQILAPLVEDWSVEWRMVYSKNEAAPSTPSSRGLRIPCPIARPPLVLGSLIHNFDKSLGEPLPETAGRDKFYPTMSMLNRLFQLVAASTWSESSAQKCHELLAALPSLDLLLFSVQACVLQIKHIISAGDETVAAIQKKGTPKPRDLFAKDLRYDEAQRCLQIKEPQPCIYGTLVDTDRFQAGEIMRAQLTWSTELGTRALASAYGRAALEMGNTTLLLWDQISSPAIDFSGICTETGISIPAVYKTLAEAAKANPWGVFAHGVALGLSVAVPAPGIDSLWVLTSAKIKSENKEVFAGFVYGMGLAGNLKSLENWQFYESLVNTDKYGTLAVLLGVAASKMRTGDTKVTKIFSVHIRALLPRGMSVQHFVHPEIEHGALVALGLLYFGSGTRHISDKIQQQLEHAGDAKSHILDGNEMEFNETYKFALGLCLGLINCARGSVNGLEWKLPSVIMDPQDESVESHERVNGAIVAVLCAFVGSNNSGMAKQLAHLRFSPDAEYMAPTTFFGRALALHLCMWDSVGKSKAWIDQQCDSFGMADDARASISGPTESADGLNVLPYLYWKAGVLAAMAMRHAGTSDEIVISTICEEIEELFLPLYVHNLYRLIDSYRQDHQGEEHHFDYLRSHFVKALAQLLGHLAIAAGAVAAGSGNLRVMRLLRQLWQIAPQFQAFAAMSKPQSSESEMRRAIEISSAEFGLDLGLIAQSLGWLFMSNGRRSFKTDCESVALLACSSFIEILGGANVDTKQWKYMQSLWSLVTEQRCLFASHNPSDKVEIEIYYHDRIERAKMPLLLPPFDQISKIKVVDERYVAIELSNLCETPLMDGIRLTPRARDSAKLETMLRREMTRNERRQPKGEVFASRYAHLEAILEDMARYPQSSQDELELTLLLSFYRQVRPDAARSSVFSDRWLEQVQLKSWLSQRGE